MLSLQALKLHIFCAYDHKHTQFLPPSLRVLPEKTELEVTAKNIVVVKVVDGHTFSLFLGCFLWVFSPHFFPHLIQIASYGNPHRGKINI